MATDYTLDHLLEPGELVADYTLHGDATNAGAVSRQCVISPTAADLPAALEDTLHRIIADRVDEGDADELIRETMGAVRDDPQAEGPDIDLGYRLLSPIVAFHYHHHA